MSATVDHQRIVLFGAESGRLSAEVRRHPSLQLVEEAPDTVVCFGGDGTLLAAELQWPGIPKAPIRNSRRGVRCIPHPPHAVIERLAGGRLVPTQFLKLEGELFYGDGEESVCTLTAMNEFNVHMGHVNSAVRFKLWLNDGAYLDGMEILGDGCVISTPFGSTAYFNQITRGLFHTGLGIAFKATNAHTDHMVVPDDVEVRMAITRGPAVLAFDNSPEYFDLVEGDELVVRKHEQTATILTWDPIRHPCDIF